MPNMTLAIPNDLKEKMDQHKEINWSEVARESFLKRLKRDEAFNRFDEILKNSEMTDELASRLGDELKKKVAKRHGL